LLYKEKRIENKISRKRDVLQWKPIEWRTDFERESILDQILWRWFHVKWKIVKHSK